MVRRIVVIASLAALVAPASHALGAAALPDAPAVAQVKEVRTTWTAEFGMPRPDGIAYVPARDELVVAAAGANATHVLRLDRDEHVVGSETLPRTVDPGAIAFDPEEQRLAAVDADRLDIGAAGGATVDAGGTWFTLDAAGPAIVQADAPDAAGATSRVPLPQFSNASVAGLAHNPSDGLLYLLRTDKPLLHAIEPATGATVKTLDLGGVSLQDPRAMTFAPSTDSTDDPATQNLFVADAGGGAASGGVVELSLAAVTAAAPISETGTLVRMTPTSAWTPASPDPSGITWLPGVDRLWVTDSEVEETTGAGYHGVNLWQATRLGAVTDTGTTFPAVSREPNGLGYIPASNTLLISNDSLRRIHLMRPGNDQRFGTSDDQVTYFNALPYSYDTEDPTYDLVSGDMFFLDGVDTEVWRVNAVNGVFGDGNDVVTHFDVGQYGITDTEALEYHPARDTLVLGDRTSRRLIEVSKTGDLLREINLSGIAGLQFISGLTIAPASNGSGNLNYWIVDRAQDNGPNPNENDGKLFEISGGTSTNTAPVVTSVTIDQASPTTNQTLTASVIASDADNDPLEYRYQWRRNGVAIAGATNPTFDLAVPGNGDKGDAISVRVVAFDGFVESAPRTSSQVTIVNSPPTFAQDLGNRTSAEGANVSLAATATDPDNDPIVYEASGLPPGVGIGAATGTISGTIAAGAAGASPYDVTVTVREGVTVDATDTFVWTVTPTATNVEPVVDSATIDQAAPKTNDSLTVTVQSHDDNGDQVQHRFQWYSNGAPVAGAMSPSLDLGLAGNGDKGDEIAVRVTAFDGILESAPVMSAPVTIVNTDPVFDQDLGNRTSTEGDAVSIAATATDADNDPLTYAASGLPSGVTLDGNTGLITGTIGIGAAGASPYATSVTVRDGPTVAATDSFTWTVNPLPVPPAAPSALTASVTAASVVLDWADNTEPNLTGYRVARATSAAGPFTLLTPTLLTASTYTDASAPRGTSYYQVVAVNSLALASAPAETQAVRTILWQSASSAGAKDATSLTINRPAAVAIGDLLVAALDVRGTPTITPPSGWTLVRIDVNGTTMRQAVYSRVVGLSEPSSYRWLFSTKASAAGLVVAYRGADTAAGVQGTSGQANGSSTTITAPSVTTAAPGALVVGFFGIATNATFTPPPGMREAIEVSQNGGKNKAAIEAADLIAPLAGATGARSATSSSSALNVGQLVVVNPGP